jgi:hypothetical protein
MSNLEKIDKRVARGVHYLEKHYGTEWRERVVDPISQVGTYSCVLAQVAQTDYWRAVDGHTNRWAVRRGFNAPDASDDFNQGEYYRALDEAWEVEVGMRDFQPLKDDLVSYWSREV